MHLVAIAMLRSTDTPSLEALADQLGTTLYELKLLLNAGFPAVVMATVDEERAAAAFAYIQRHHRGVLLDRRDATPNSAMTALRDFRFDAAGIAHSTSSSELMRYDDVLAILRATHRSTVKTTKEVQERELRPGMAIATGGVVSWKTTTKEVTSKTEERQQVLYFFRRSAAPAWILREREVRYTGLGPELRPTSLENFATTIRLLRARAPNAVYDDRLVNARAIRGVAEGVEAVDLLAHVLAADIRQAPP